MITPSEAEWLRRSCGICTLIPIEISTLYVNHYVGIKIENKIAEPCRYHGSGIGTKNIKAMMQQMNGLCEIKFASDYYCIILYFPIDL